MAEEQVVETEEQLTPEQQAEAAEEQARLEAEQKETERAEQEETEKKPWFKKRFDEITRQKYLEKQRADAAEARQRELEERLKKIEKKEEPQQPIIGKPKPKLSDFISTAANIDEANENYAEAIADWKLEQYAAKQNAEAQKRAQRDEQNRRLQTFEQKRVATVTAGKSKYPDWEQEVFSIPEQIMNPNMANAIVEMEDGSDIAYYLAKNLQEAEKVSQMNPYAMAAELGKISAKLNTQTKKTTSAPAPLSHLKGKKAVSSEIDPEKDPEGWIKARNEGRI